MKKLGMTLVIFFATIAIGHQGMASENAPQFKLMTLSGQVVSTKTVSGKPTLLMFWASWCSVCQRELPNLNALYTQKQKGLNVLSVGFQDEETNIRGYLHSQATPFLFQTAYDKGNAVSSAFHVRATPTFVLLDADGKILLVHEGGGFLKNPRLQQLIQPLL